MPEPTQRQLEYYQRLSKLSQEQRQQAYSLYNVPLHQRPTIQALAAKFQVSYTVMARALRLEAYRAPPE